VNDYSHQTVITLQPGRSRPDTVVECANCSLHVAWVSGYIPRWSNPFDNQLNVCIHDTASCQTGLTTGLTTMLNEQHCSFSRLLNSVVQPVWQTRFDSCVEGTAVRSTGCQTGLYNRFDNWLYTRYSRLSNRLSNGFDNRL